MLTLVYNDELSSARAGSDAAMDKARMRGSMSSVASVSTIPAIVAHRCGQLDDAISDVGSASSTSSEPHPLSVAWATAPLIEALIEQGNLDEADTIARQAAATPSCSPPKASPTTKSHKDCSSPNPPSKPTYATPTKNSTSHREPRSPMDWA